MKLFQIKHIEVLSAFEHARDIADETDEYVYVVLTMSGIYITNDVPPCAYFEVQPMCIEHNERHESRYYSQDSYILFREVPAVLSSLEHMIECHPETLLPSRDLIALPNFN